MTFLLETIGSSVHRIIGPFAPDKTDSDALGNGTMGSNNIAIGSGAGGA
jgi:hypothetical protein